MLQPPKLTSCSTFSFEDSDELCAVARQWNLDFRQIERGPFRGELDVMAGPTLVLQRVRLNRRFHQSGRSPEGATTFGVVNDERLCNWLGNALPGGSVLNFNRIDGYESVSERDFDGYTFSVPEEYFLDRLRRITPEFNPDSLRRQIHYVGNNHALKRRLRVLAHLLGPRGDRLLNDRQALELQDDIFCLLLEGITAGQAEAEISSATERKIAVDRAVEFIAASRGAALLSEIQRMSGVSSRTLARGFQERFGVSPKKYLVFRRLVDAKRALLSAGRDKTVTDIAMDLGFTHLGRFATDYKRMFGERPSATLQRHSV